MPIAIVGPVLVLIQDPTVVEWSWYMTHRFQDSEDAITFGADASETHSF